MAPSLAVIESLFEQASAMGGVERQQFLSTIEPLELRAEVEDLLERSEAGDALVLKLEGAVNSAMEALLDRFEDPQIGAQIGRFEVRAILGDGGHTRVFRAFDPELQREVAIKVLSASSGLPVERFMAEARTLSALEHPHIGLVYEIGESQSGDRYIVMPLYAGPTLAAVLRDGGLSTAKALEIAVQLAGALAAAHRAGIVHRDVKAANVIFESEASVRLLDFGIAKLSESDKTEHNIIVGTVAYMSPEQTRGSGVDQRTDVWSLGVLLYEMLAGEKPFSGDSAEAVIHQIRHDQAADPAAVPRWLRGVLHRALAKDPGERFQSMEAFLHALNRRGTLPEDGGNSFLIRLPGFLKTRSRGLAIALAALVATSLGVYLLAPDRQPARQQVAVIPFENLGAGTGDEYLPEGIAAQLREQLGSVEGLSVVGPESSGEIRPGELGPKSLATALGARWLITGELARQEDRLHLRIHIIDGESGRRLWSRSYRQGMGELLDLQQRLVDDTVEQLGVGGAAGAVRSSIAVNSESAYLLMLQADNVLNDALGEDVIDQEELDRSISLYREAVESDPDSALLNARLAAALLYRGSVNEAQVFIERAQGAAQALSQVAHTMGLYLYARHGDGVGEHLKRAVELNPSNAEALEDYGLYLYARAEVAAARTHLERARLIDPLSIRRYEALGNFYGIHGYYEEAQQLALQIARRFDSAAAGLVVSRVYEVMGDLDRAIAWSMLAGERNPPNQAWRWRIAELYARIGESGMAQSYDAEPSVARLYFSRQYDELIEKAFNLVLEDGSSAALFILARAYAATDRADIVVRLMGTQNLPERIYRDSATTADIEAGVMLADALVEVGQQEEASRLIAHLVPMFRQWSAGNRNWHSYLNLACLLSISGEEEGALAELEKIADTPGLPWYPVLRDQPCFRARLAGNPRYAAVLEGVLERRRQLREALPLTLQQLGVADNPQAGRNIL